MLGPKCLQELPQEPPEPSQASILTDFRKLFDQILIFFVTINAEERGKENEKKACIPSCFWTFWGDKTPGTVQNCHRALQATGAPVVQMGTVAGRPKVTMKIKNFTQKP